MNRRAVASIAILVVIALGSLIAGAQLAQTFKPNHNSQGQQMSDAGAALGGAIAGPPGEILGRNVGSLMALFFGIVAAQRHGAATAATAQVRHLTTTVTKPPGT